MFEIDPVNFGSVPTETQTNVGFNQFVERLKITGYTNLMDSEQGRVRSASLYWSCELKIGTHRGV